MLLFVGGGVLKLKSEAKCYMSRIACGTRPLTPNDARNPNPALPSRLGT